MTDKKVDYNASSSPESDQDIAVGEDVPIEDSKDGEYHRSISARQIHVRSI
jgi:hypothetical protein